MMNIVIAEYIVTVKFTVIKGMAHITCVADLTFGVENTAVDNTHTVSSVALAGENRHFALVVRRSVEAKVSAEHCHIAAEVGNRTFLSKKRTSRSYFVTPAAVIICTGCIYGICIFTDYPEPHCTCYAVTLDISRLHNIDFAVIMNIALKYNCFG